MTGSEPNTNAPAPTSTKKVGRWRETLAEINRELDNTNAQYALLREKLEPVLAEVPMPEPLKDEGMEACELESLLNRLLMRIRDFNLATEILKQGVQL